MSIKMVQKRAKKLVNICDINEHCNKGVLYTPIQLILESILYIFTM